MPAYTLTHRTDADLLRALAALVAQDRATTATLLAHLAEFDARRLYLPAGHASMHAYCVDALHLSDAAALKRIQAARAARQFPALFLALADGRLHLTAVRLLAPHFTAENVEELIEAAAHRRAFEIEGLIARRFAASSSPVRAQVRVIRPVPVARHAPGQVDALPLLAESPAQVPAAAERFVLQLTIDKSTHDKLRHAQALLSHALPSGDVAIVLDRALDALIARSERQKFAASDRARSGARATTARRHIPASIKRQVWERDGGQCAFVGEHGHRCAARRFLEFDHADPVARGGQATVDGIRLRCRAHNQLEAERAFGSDFMAKKRAQARHAHELIAGLRALGCRVDEARSAAEHAETLGDAPLEERMHVALKFLRPRASRSSGDTAH